MICFFMLPSNAQKAASTNYVEKHSVIYLNKAEFIKRVSNYEQSPNEWKYLGDKPCIIDFYTTWCGPCKRLAPILEDIANEYNGQIYVYKVDAEKEAELSRAFRINSYPSLLFCPMQGKPQMALGLLPKENLQRIVDQLLLGKKPAEKTSSFKPDSTNK